MTKVIYTGLFVDDVPQLLNLVPVELSGKNVQLYAHHVTKEFRPKDGVDSVQVGKKRLLVAYAQVVTNDIQVLLVKADDGSNISTNDHPHITIATAHNIKPSESNKAIYLALQNQSVDYFKNPITIATTEGYFDGVRVHTSLLKTD